MRKKHKGTKQQTIKKKLINEKIKEEIKNYLQIDENKNTTLQSLWDAAKADLREKFIAIQTYVREQEKSQIKILTYHL